jgi:hypothetical protein
MSFFQCLGSVGLAVLVVPGVQAEPPCPANVTSLPLRIVQSSLIVVSVQINHSGPYDFVVDTGAQISTVDPPLASELRLKAEGTAGSGGVATFSRNEFVHLGLLQAGDRSVTNSLAVIQDIADLHSADPLIRGILGDCFLEHFDLLIDNRRKILCLDDTNSMASAFKSEPIGLASPLGPEKDLPFTQPLIIAVQVAGSTDNPLLLRLDSGSNAPVLYSPAPRLLNTAGDHISSLARVVSGHKQGFQVLAALDLRIGKHTVPQVSFAVPKNSLGQGPSAREDGILPTMAFQRVFISAEGHYAAIESW